MKIKRTTAITVRTQQVTTLRFCRQPMLGWCEACAARVTLASPEHAAERLRVSVRAIYRGIEAGRVHFSETERGALLVCLDSLTTLTDQSQ